MRVCEIGLERLGSDKLYAFSVSMSRDCLSLAFREIHVHGKASCAAWWWDADGSMSSAAF